MSVVANSTIYFASYEQLNDPFEYSYEWSVNARLTYKIKFWESQNELYRASLDGLNFVAKRTALEHWEEAMAPPRGHKFIGAHNYGIFCACSKLENLVLWSHYADNHRGVCFVFESKNDPVLAKAIPVRYSKTIGKYYLYKGYDQRDLLTRKFADWKYESEHRCFNKPGVYTFKKKALKAVIFGLNTWMDSKNRKRAEKLSEVCRTNFPNTKIGRAIRIDGTYRFSVEEC